MNRPSSARIKRIIDGCEAVQKRMAFSNEGDRGRFYVTERE